MFQIHNPDKDITDLDVCHSCDNPSCVNIDHLFAATHLENIQDCISKNRHMKGSMQTNSTLTESVVIDILNNIENGNITSIQQISNKYLIMESVIYRILNEKTWMHITKDFDMKKIKNMVTHTEFRKKLSDTDVLDIKSRLNNNESVKSVSILYNVDTSSIYKIKNGIFYSYV